jgi:methyl-accepting chemotaxis protein
VTQRNASAAEELSSTAEEMASQSEALQQLMGYFLVKDHEGGYARPHLAPPGKNGAAHPAPAAHPPAPKPAAAALPARRTNGAPGEGGFSKF